MRKKFYLQLDCSNDEFVGPELKPAVARILREVAAQLELDELALARHHNIRDINGNVVGSFILRN